MDVVTAFLLEEVKEIKCIEIPDSVAGVVRNQYL